MAADGGGIVNVASLAGLREHYAYAACKAPLIMATKMLTDMGQQVWGDEEKAAPMRARIPLGHFGVPSDVAHAVVNGAEIALDGGFTVA
jgi:NAD(P)-dependent dehydrogenase (short-subunit alcohol dehydrogenase family)